MGKLLLAAPEHVGIIDVLLEGLHKYTDHSIDFLDLHAEPFCYKNKQQRMYNFFLKTFTGQNIKKRYYNRIFKERIAVLKKNYDIILIIRPDILNNAALGMLRSRANYFVAYYWDVVSFFPRKLAIRKYFDKIFSFDPADCNHYGFYFLSNFYYYEKETPIAYQVYNISTYDYRKDFIEKIAERLQQLHISFCLKAVHHAPFQNIYITYLPEVLNYREMLSEIAATQVLLEVQKKEQRGLTFRPFEALGLNKKLITTNPEIRKYDFFDENNILVLEYTDEAPEIPADFFFTPYKPVEKEKREKYHLKNWISTILGK